MFNTDVNFLFPPDIIPSLIDARGPTWRKLVNAIVNSKPDSIEKIAFVLMMTRISNCALCNKDSYRAMHGCKSCVIQSLKRYHGTDENLTDFHNSAIFEIKDYLQKQN